MAFGACWCGMWDAGDKPQAQPDPSVRRKAERACGRRTASYAGAVHERAVFPARALSPWFWFWRWLTANHGEGNENKHLLQVMSSFPRVQTGSQSFARRCWYLITPIPIRA